MPEESAVIRGIVPPGEYDANLLAALRKAEKRIAELETELERIRRLPLRSRPDPLTELGQ